MSDHPAVEAVARYLARDYWGDEERRDEFVDRARVVVDIVETAQVPQRVVLSDRRPYTPWSEVKAHRAAEREMRVALGISDPCECGCGLVLHQLVFDNPKSYRIPCEGCECQVYSPVRREVRDVGRIARVWAAGDPEPEDRPTVRDKDGDERYPLEVEGWKREGIAPTYSWKSMLVAWGPVTEVWDD